MVNNWIIYIYSDFELFLNGDLSHEYRTQSCLYQQTNKKTYSDRCNRRSGIGKTCRSVPMTKTGARGENISFQFIKMPCSSGTFIVFSGKICVLLLLFLDHHENILVLLLHEELFAGILLEVVPIGGEFVKPGRVKLDLLPVILLVVFKLPDLGRHLHAVDHIVLVKKQHPDGKHRNGENILIPDPGPYCQKEFLHTIKVFKKEVSRPFPDERLSTVFQ